MFIRENEESMSKGDDYAFEMPRCFSGGESLGIWFPFLSSYVFTFSKKVYFCAMSGDTFTVVHMGAGICL